MKSKKLQLRVFLKFLAVGFHPILFNEYEFKQSLFYNALKSTKFVGEVGLDYSVARTEKVGVNKKGFLSRYVSL